MIHLDLTRDLPRALAMRDQLIKNLGDCRYSAPCVIGAMMTEEEREELPEDYDGALIWLLANNGYVGIPCDQRIDFRDLQYAFDKGDPDYFTSKLDSLASKYLEKAE